MNAVIIALPAGKKYKFGKDKVTLGRNKSNDIVNRKLLVSGTHCAIYKKGNRFYIEDLKSSNGTFINSKKIAEPAVLKNNDTITLGQKGPIYQFHKTGILENLVVRKHIINLRFTVPIAVGAIIFIAIVITLLTGLGKINIDKELSEIRKVHGKNSIPVDQEFVDLVAGYVQDINNDSALNEILGRRFKYLNTIERVLSENNIPKDFSFLVWVESKYDPLAYNSYSGAKGMWQMMPATARQYGLTVNSTIDERTDPEKSTQAAAAYLNDLISIFGADSFTLAIAAYNAGDGAILYRLKQVENPITDRNFWYLCKNDLLPAETKHYVIQVIALMVLSKRLN